MLEFDCNVYGCLHFLVHFVGYEWVDKEGSPDFVHVICLHSVEELEDLFVCRVALVDDCVECFVIELFSQSSFGNVFKLFVSYHLIRLILSEDGL